MKSQLTIDSPESVRCKEAGKRLYQSLKDAGYDLTGVGIGLSKDKKNPAIHMMFKRKPKRGTVPPTFEGYEVNVVVTGVIRPLGGS
jgi:hypothetical protein